MSQITWADKNTGDFMSAVQMNEVKSVVNGNALNDTVLVKSIADFPTAVGGVIDLATNTTYVINGDIAMGTTQVRFSAGSMLIGTNRGTDRLTYLGTAHALLNSGNQVNMSNVGIIAPLGYWGNLSMGTQFLSADWCTFIAKEGGIVSGGAVPSFKLCLFGDPTGTVLANNLITFTGTIDKVFISECPFYGLASNGACITFDNPTVKLVHIQSSFFKLGNGTFSGIKWINGTSAPTEFGIVNACTFDGTFTRTENFDQTTAGWDFTANEGIADSSVSGGWRFTGNSTQTNITTQNAWVKVTGATGYALERMSFASDTITYTAIRPKRIALNVAIICETIANSQDYEFAVFRNGTLEANSVTPVSFRFASTTHEPTIVAIVDMVNGDEFDIRVRNTTSTANILIPSLQGYFK